MKSGFKCLMALLLKEKNIFGLSLPKHCWSGKRKENMPKQVTTNTENIVIVLPLRSIVFENLDAEILYQTIREVNEEYLQAGERVRDFFTENMKNKVYTLASLLKNIDNSKTKTSRREEHPEWFEGKTEHFFSNLDYLYEYCGLFTQFSSVLIS